jgi:hypothetical protein
MNHRHFLSVLVGLLVASEVSVAAGDVRVKVALLDGVPVYHWRAFKSQFSDDVNRALVLREFNRQEFLVPDHYVEQALQEVITEHFHADKAAFEDRLRHSGASIAEYKQFLAEELILGAFPFIAKHAKVADSPAARAKWIASLRKSAKITLLR